MELEEQRALVEKFNSWFDSSGPGANASYEQGWTYRQMIDDSRRRYRMQLDTKARDRKRNNLSCLPSTKSMSITDHAVEQFLNFYHGEPDAISYTAKSTVDADTELKARWLSKLFDYRANRTAKFYVWHKNSLQSALVDGIECAMVSWVKEAYTEPEKCIKCLPNGTECECDEDEMLVMGAFNPQAYKLRPAQEIITRDTWWIDQLMPGDTVFWDANAPMMDANLGQWACVKLYKNEDEMKYLAKIGIFDALEDEEAIDDAIGAHGDSFNYKKDRTRISSDPLTTDMGEEGNLAEVWCFFYKENFRWMVQFSTDGKDILSNPRPVDDVFWGGRKCNLLPVVIGTHDRALWENIGRGIPMNIASLEDEYSNARNNMQDAANIALQKKYLIAKGSDVDINQLIHMPAVYADPGEVQEMNTSVSIMESLRATDALQSDIAEVSPGGMMSRGRSIVPNGTDQTLGAMQMVQQETGGKLESMLKMRNATFMEPLLYRIAILMQVFETDQNILRIAAGSAGYAPPMVPDTAGNMQVDPRALDLEFDVSINAGMGSMPKYQKAQTIMQIADWRVSHGVPTDMPEVAKQLNTLAGLDPNQFEPKQPPPPSQPKVEYKLNVDMPALLLPPEAQQFLMQQLMSGGVNVTTKVDGDPQSAANQRLTQQMAQRTGMFSTPQGSAPVAQQAAANAGAAPMPETGAMNAQ